MTDRSEITLICPTNDLESATIVSIAQSLSIDVRVSAQKWGGRLGKEADMSLRDLKKTIVVVELPDPAAEARLRAEGHEVIIIDHHDYSDIDRWQPESSIEQFCRFVGEPMDEDRWAIAVNDRDFIPGMARLGLSYENMERIRQRERDVMGVADLFEEALKSGEPLRRFDDLDVFLVPSRYVPIMGEVAQWPSKTDYDNGVRKGVLPLRNCLVLYHREGHNEDILQVRYYGEAKFRPAFREVLKEPLFADFEMWVGGGASSCFWGAKPRTGSMNATGMSDLIDRILSFTLVWGRPLRHFSTTFLFPFRFEKNALPKIVVSHAEQPSRPEQFYFLPQVRDLFLGRGSDVVEEWELPIPDGDALTVQQEAMSLPIGLPVKRICLCRFFNGLHILSVDVSQRTDVKFWEQLPLWKALIHPDYSERHSIITATQALVFNNLARVVYLSYPEQMQEHKAPVKVTWRQTTWEPDPVGAEYEVSAVVQAILGEFTGSHYEVDTPFLWDDRMFVHTCMAFAGEKPMCQVGEDSYHALFTLGTYVDRDGFDHLGGYAYDKGYVRDLIEPVTYRRWYGVSGNLYGFSRFSSVYLGFGKFFHDPVTTHISTIYRRMSIIGLFYRASLIHYGHFVAGMDQPESENASDAEMRAFRRQLHKVHWQLTRFTNKYWFNELTAQDQGVELFNLQTAALDVKKQYERVKGDIDRAYQVLEGRTSFDLSRQSFSVGLVGLVLSVVFLMTVFFKFETGSPLQIPVNLPWLPWTIFGFAVAGIVVGISIFFRGLQKILRR